MAVKRKAASERDNSAGPLCIGVGPNESPFQLNVINNFYCPSDKRVDFSLFEIYCHGASGRGAVLDFRQTNFGPRLNDLNLNTDQV